VTEALRLGYPAARVLTDSAAPAPPIRRRCASFDGDAVLFSDEAERVFQTQGLDAFQRHELEHAAQPLPEGPFKPLLAALHRLQQAAQAGTTSGMRCAPPWSPRAAPRPMSAPSIR
jgi:5'-nucleotidase